MAVEVDLERPLGPPAGDRIAAVALVADADLSVGLAAELQGPFHIFEVDVEAPPSAEGPGAGAARRLHLVPGVGLDLEVELPELVESEQLTVTPSLLRGISSARPI